MNLPPNITTIAVIKLARVMAIIPLRTPFECIDITYAIPGAENVRGKASGTISHLLRYS